MDPMVAEDCCTYEVGILSLCCPSFCVCIAKCVGEGELTDCGLQGMAIKRWLLLKQTSPMTGRQMGTELVSNQFLCNLSKAYRACADNNTRAV